MGASVGDEWIEDNGKEAGSMSRSGMGGDNRGLRVILRRMSRRIALTKQYQDPCRMSRGMVYFMVSIKTIPRHLAWAGNLRLITISTRS